MLLYESLDELIHREGGDFFGVADLSSAQDFISKQGGKLVEPYPRAISIGIALLDNIVDNLPQNFESYVAEMYLHHYEITNLRLDLLAGLIASIIQKEGYSALPIPASRRFSDENIASIFSHKLSANLAGLGWIGKSCLLITPEFGPRVRWVTILTDAPLNTGDTMDDLCGDCRECVDACPVGAFTGRNFSAHESREDRYDAAACEKYLNDLENITGSGVCGLCISSCPHGGNRGKRIKKK